MELYKGRPENTEGRLEREIRTYDLLDELGIEYFRTDHERADNMEACFEIDAVLGVIICKNLFLCNRQKTVRTDRIGKAFFCGCGRYAQISGYRARLRERHGTDE